MDYNEERAKILTAKMNYGIADTEIAKAAKLSSAKVGDFIAGCYIGAKLQDRIILATNDLVEHYKLIGKSVSSEAAKVKYARKRGPKDTADVKALNEQRVAKNFKPMSDEEFRKFVWKNQNKPTMTLAKRCGKTSREIMDVYSDMLEEQYQERLAKEKNKRVHNNV